MFCLAVKSGEYHRPFTIHKAAGPVQITRNNFSIVRPTFGTWAAKTISRFSKEPVLVIPVPSKTALHGVETYGSLEMAQQALAGTAYKDSVCDALRWNKELKRAHEGGPRLKSELLPHLEMKAGVDVKGKKVALIDDLCTRGGSLLACEERLTEAGATVLGAVTCGRAVYNATNPPFKPSHVDFTEELADLTPLPGQGDTANDAEIGGGTARPLPPK